MPTRPTLEREIARLAALQRELRVTLDRVERTLQRLSAQSASARETTAGLTPRRPLRVQILDVLGEIKLMSYTREIAAYAFGRYDLVIPAGRFGSLASDEIESHDRRGSPRSRNRAVWVCFGLRHDDAAPVRRLVARSDWPVEDRIWAPTTGRVQHLRMIARLCELALGDAQLANPDALSALVHSYARDLPIRTMPGEYDFEGWREHALALLDEDDLQARDHDVRLQAAERWSGLSETHQLFGRDPAEMQVAARG